MREAKSIRHEGRAILVAAILASFVAFLDGSIVNVGLPAMAEEFRATLAFQQWVVDGYALSLAALILTAGALSDRLGRVRILVIGTLGFGAASVACALAPTAEWLIGLRFLQGAAAALLVPSSLALIAGFFRGPAQAKAIGIWSAWTSCAFIAGPLLGGVIVDSVGWRWIFGVNVVPVAATIVAVLQLRSDSAPGRSRIDVRGAVLAALGLGGVTFALIEQGGTGWTSPIVYIPLIAGTLFLAAFIRVEQITDAPMMPLKLFHARNFWAGNLITFVVWGALWLGVFVIPVYLQQVVGYSALQAGLATAPMTLISLLVSGPVGSLAGKYGAKPFIVLGPVVAAGGYLLMAVAGHGDATWLVVASSVSLVGLGIATTSTPVSATVLSAVRADQAGIGSAVNNAVARFAGLIAVAFVGVATGTHLDAIDFRNVTAAVAVFMLAGATVAALTLTSERVSEDGLSRKTER